MSAESTIVSRERKFWDTMISKDAEAASAMMAKKSIVVGPQGASEISRGDFAKMMTGSSWTLESYELDDVNVVFPDETTAVIAYKVAQKGKMDGKPYDMHCADATTWSKIGGEWLCVLHTETVLDDSAGRKAA